ncbi:histidine kinase [Chitinophaga niastensis]|uniref:Histidine kinase n=1 Tax=Chitinophaga niastensis TaxID=536980 RepID=A0A2P8HGY0_CHINA|nr:histidine kinase [Chitinophaga niastensis]PSL45472.1 histidine kinase [Chitinophaga niastensis]
MYFPYRLFILLTMIISGLYSCSRQDKHAPAPARNNDPAIVVELQQLIDSGARWNGPAMKDKMKQLKPVALASGDKAKGLYYYLEGIHYWYADSLPAANKSFRQMLRLTPVDTSRYIDLIALQQIGMIHLAIERKVDDSTFSRTYALIDISQRFLYPDMWRVYEIAAEVHFRYGVYDKAKTYTDKAIALFHNKEDYYRQSYFMEELSRIAERQHKYQQAMAYEDSALQLASKQPDSIRLATVYAALGVLYEKNGDKNKGHALMVKAFAIKERLDKVTFREYVNYGQIFLEEKDYPKAILYLNKALNKAREPQNAGNLNSAYGTLYNIYYENGDYKNAIAYLDSSTNMALTEMEEQQLKKVMELQAINELKEQQHKNIYISRQYQNQAIILRQQRFILAIFGILLLVGVALTIVLIRQRKLRSQKLSIELEQRLLRSQMEPHFIFNTLAVLQSFIRHDEKEKSVKYLNKFARLLRINLESSRHNLVQLHQEVEALENYLSLQAIRFGNVFDYAIHPIEGCEDMDIFVPPMLLQPFVENAIQHGMRNLPYKGMITITLQLQNNLLHCVIEDNGQGLQEKSTREKNSLSSTITQERLKILSERTGKLASLVIVDKKEKGGNGVKVTLIVPTQQEH